MDSAVLEVLQKHSSENTLLVSFFVTFTQMGLYKVVLPLSAVGGLILLRRAPYRLMFVWLTAMVVDVMLQGRLKVLFQRPRPLSSSASDWSFPSGHVSVSIIGYGLLAYLLLEVGGRGTRFATGVLFVALILSMGLSRLYLGHHYVTDVLGSLAFGTSWVAASVLVLEIIRARTGTETASQDGRSRSSG